MPKHSKKHLHTRLSRKDIDLIYDRINHNECKFALCEEYDLSVESIDRILDKEKWTNAQRRKWGYTSCPGLMSNISYKKGSKGKPKKKKEKKDKKVKDTAVHHKTGEYESGATDGERYAKDNMPKTSLVENLKGSELVDSVEKTLREDHSVPLEKVIEIMDGPGTDLIEDSPAEKYFDRLPTFKARMDMTRLIHHLEAVDACFELLQEEMESLKEFLFKE